MIMVDQVEYVKLVVQPVARCSASGVASRAQRPVLSNHSSSTHWPLPVAWGWAELTTKPGSGMSIDL